MCDQSAEQQRDGFTGRQEQAMGTFRCRRGLPYEAKSLHSGEEREYHVRVGVPNRKFWLYIQVFGRREDRKGIEPNDENTTLEQPTALTAKLEDEPLSA